jgi:hypothetical protein
MRAQGSQRRSMRAAVICWLVITADFIIIDLYLRYLFRPRAGHPSEGADLSFRASPSPVKSPCFRAFLFPLEPRHRPHASGRRYSLASPALGTVGRSASTWRGYLDARGKGIGLFLRFFARPRLMRPTLAIVGTSMEPFAQRSPLRGRTRTVSYSVISYS